MAAPTAHPPFHTVARAVARLGEVLDEVADASVWSMDPDETRSTLVELTRASARLAELELRVAAHAESIEVGEATGATSTAELVGTPDPADPDRGAPQGQPRYRALRA